MIITKLIGGNGNQMFQYAAGLNLALKNKTDLLLDINDLLDQSKRYYRHEQRDYALGMFNISAKIASDKQIERFTVPRTGNKYLYHLKKRIIPSRNCYREAEFESVESFKNLSGDLYIEGYWQNNKFIQDIEHQLKNDFTFKNKLPVSCEHFLRKILNCNSVCVIFRRGDFVNHPFLDIVKLDFYYEAIKLINKLFSDLTFFVFSDDINWCQENFKPDIYNVNFVDQSHTGPEAEYYLHMITLCNHFIIPNSTFAWWGAWLSKNNKKIVIAPSKWHKNQIEQRNFILPDEWITL